MLATLQVFSWISNHFAVKKSSHETKPYSPFFDSFLGPTFWAISLKNCRIEESIFTRSDKKAWTRTSLWSSFPFATDGKKTWLEDHVPAWARKSKNFIGFKTNLRKVVQVLRTALFLKDKLTLDPNKSSSAITSGHVFLNSKLSSPFYCLQSTVSMFFSSNFAKLSVMLLRMRFFSLSISVSERSWNT